MGRFEILLYRLMLLAFPRRVRREFGDDMLRLFEEQFVEARQQNRSALGVWLEATVDALRYGLPERWAPIASLVRRSATRENGLVRRSATRENGLVRRSATREGGWRSWMHAFRQDALYALRLLIKQPGITALAVITLALGIGANTAIFSAVNAVLLRPLPYPEQDRLVMIWEKRQTEGVLDNVVSPADYLDWEKQQQSFDAIAAFTPVTGDLTGAGEPVKLNIGGVSPPFFDILGVTMALGRTFRPEEATVGQHRVVVLGHALWRDRFGANPSIVGQKIVLNGNPSEVIGVLPATFEFPDTTLDLWAPLAMHGAPTPQPRGNHFLSVYGRLRRDVSLQQARAAMDGISAQLQDAYPDVNRNHAAHVVLLRDQLRGSVRESLLGLLAAVGFVLLIACVNVANLLLARAAARRREMAVRAAVGAGRARLAGQALTESVVLAMLGGGAGLLVAWWGIRLLHQLTPRDLQVLGADRVGLDPTVLAFTLVLSLFTGLVFGMLPAWHLASQNVSESLKDGGRTPPGVRRGLRITLVVSEIALASLLLVGAGLTLRSFQSVLRAEPGIKTEGILTAFVSLPPARYRNDAQRVAAYYEIERRFASLPGVRSVGATSHLPLSGQDSRGGVTIEGREPTPDTPTRAHPRAVTPAYFQTMGQRFIEGRNFNDGDHSESQFVIIVNETMAKRYWPGQSPLGKRLRSGGAQAWREVVGVVGDVKHWGYDRAVNPEMYVPQRQMVWAGLTYVLATDVDPATLAAAARAELKAVDPNLPLSNVRTMAEVASRSVAARRSSMLLLGIFGTLALVLAAAGIYAVMAQLVALRATEIGVRMTLGAKPAAVMGLVLKEGLLQAVAGLAIGLSGGVMVMRGFESALYKVSPADPLTLTGVGVVLLITATLACIVPARRAMRVDPVQALRG